MNASLKYLETDERNAPHNIKMAQSIVEVVPDEDVDTSRMTSQDNFDGAEQPNQPITTSSITLTTKMLAHHTP